MHGGRNHPDDFRKHGSGTYPVPCKRTICVLKSCARTAGERPAQCAGLFLCRYGTAYHKHFTMHEVSRIIPAACRRKKRSSSIIFHILYVKTTDMGKCYEKIQQERTQGKHKNGYRTVEKRDTSSTIYRKKRLSKPKHFKIYHLCARHIGRRNSRSSRSAAWEGNGSFRIFRKRRVREPAEGRMLWKQGRPERIFRKAWIWHPVRRKHRELFHYFKKTQIGGAPWREDISSKYQTI